MKKDPDDSSAILADFCQQCDDLKAILFLDQILLACDDLNKFLELKDLNPSIRVRVRVVTF